MYVCTIKCFVVNKKAWLMIWHEDCTALCHSESDSNIAIECILGSLKCILGSLESSDHVTGHVAVKIIHHNTCWSSSDHELCMGKRWRSYGSEHRKEKEEEEEGRNIVTFTSTLYRVWSVQGFRPYCKPGFKTVIMSFSLCTWNRRVGERERAKSDWVRALLAYNHTTPTTPCPLTQLLCVGSQLIPSVEKENFETIVWAGFPVQDHTHPSSLHNVSETDAVDWEDSQRTQVVAPSGWNKKHDSSSEVSENNKQTNEEVHVHSHAKTTKQYLGLAGQTTCKHQFQVPPLPTHLRGTSGGHDGGDAGSCGVALNNLVSQRCSLL